MRLSELNASLVWCTSYGVSQKMFNENFLNYGISKTMMFIHLLGILSVAYQSYSIASLSTRSEYFSRIFLYKIFRNYFVCSDVLEKQKLSAPKGNHRQFQMFHVDVARLILIFILSPILVCTLLFCSWMYTCGTVYFGIN